jgi:peptidoglycan-N-acetylglucosamine deacetylase
MHKWFIKIHPVIKWYFSAYVWSMPVKKNEKVVYLTFDDGPNPIATPFVLQQLKAYNAAATFFCIGKNVLEHTQIFEQLLAEGHAVGNHTHNHLNGWKVPAEQYLTNVAQAAKLIPTNLFRPPYGKITKQQAKNIPAALNRKDAKIIMWDVLSADFDRSLLPEQCLQNVLKNVATGSVVVFHDSEKAFKNLQYALPKVLEELSSKGYEFKKIDL